MATATNLLSKPSSSLPNITRTSPSSFHVSFHLPFAAKPCRKNLQTNRSKFNFTVKSTAASSPDTAKKPLNDEKVIKIHSKEEFDDALRSAKDKLVVVEYAATHSENSSKIYPFMVELSRTCNDVKFLLVMGDESEKTRDLCRRESVDKVPHFSFYKAMEKIHEEEAIGPDRLMGDVLYYGDNHSGVVQLHCKDDVEKLIGDHKADGKLIVLDVGLKHCGPCVKVYPMVIKLSKQMSESVVFARMNGDENESCMEFLKEMDVIEVPTFLFIRNGEISGRYVGSGKGELIGEILRYEGVKVT